MLLRRQVGRSVTSIMHDVQHTCAACGAVGEPFWQLANQPYCRDCVAKAGGEHLGPLRHDLVEDVQLPFRNRLSISMWSAFTFTVFLVVLVVAMFVAINVFFMFGGKRAPDQTLDYLARALPWFAGFSFVFAGLITLPVSLILSSSGRPRRIAVSDDTFVVDTVAVKRSFALSECLWTMPAMACDSSGFYPPRQKLIVVNCSDGRSHAMFACGFSEDTYQLWKTFLTLRKVPFKAAIPITSWMLWLSGGSVGGGLFGSLFGVVPADLMGQPLWVGAWGFLGFIDGFVWGFLGAAVTFSSVEQWRRVKSPRWQRWAVLVIVTPVTGFGLGLMIGLLTGLSGAIVTGALNAAVFVFGSWCFASAVRRKVEVDDAFPSRTE